ncbi:MAG: Mediator of RNA polymerase II transcription subunit 6 [Thelocarpon impressellum]|nr:MAG: Mediator of RNA polymerase II transcription subunit 6 [Thelocarpon impressellum]
MTVLHYFAESPFFDATSNNATLTTQANYNPALLKYVETREAFEGQLRTMQGVEFVVACEPAQAGAWVVRKQARRKRPGAEDDITVLNTYFIIGETVYTAPSVGDVLGSRLVGGARERIGPPANLYQLSTVTSLTKFLSTASSLPLFSPSRGYTYIPPVPKAPSSAVSSQLSQTSKENTPMPDVPGRSGRLSNPPTTSITSSAFQEARSLAESFSMAMRYGDEYMDEHPLIGEPGSFILASTHGNAQGQARSQPRAQAWKKAATPAVPQPLNTAAPPAPTRKGSRGGEKSPTSPAPGKPKRKKSKPVVATMSTASPS